MTITKKMFLEKAGIDTTGFDDLDGNEIHINMR